MYRQVTVAGLSEQLTPAQQSVGLGNLISVVKSESEALVTGVSAAHRRTETV